MKAHRNTPDETKKLTPLSVHKPKIDFFKLLFTTLTKSFFQISSRYQRKVKVASKTILFNKIGSLNEL